MKWVLLTCDKGSFVWWTNSFLQKSISLWLTFLKQTDCSIKSVLWLPNGNHFFVHPAATEQYAIIKFTHSLQNEGNLLLQLTTKERKTMLLFYWQKDSHLLWRWVSPCRHDEPSAGRRCTTVQETWRKRPSRGPRLSHSGPWLPLSCNGAGWAARTGSGRAGSTGEGMKRCSLPFIAQSHHWYHTPLLILVSICFPNPCSRAAICNLLCVKFYSI